MKRYVVMYKGPEGWIIHGQTDSFQEAVDIYLECLSYSREASIFKPVELEIKEKG